MNIAILASTNASILPDIVYYTRKMSPPNTSPKFSVLIGNIADCGALKKAKALDIPALIIIEKNREKWENRTLNILREKKIDLVVLVGFMRILSPLFVEQYRGRILNVHPSLLPKFAGGMDGDVHEAVLAAKETESGATIHLVTEELDVGRIIAQEAVKISKGEIAESLKKKIQKIEGKLFAKAIKKMNKKY